MIGRTQHDRQGVPVARDVVRLRCQGHAAIRATHANTLEFTPDADITARATCVLGVGATVVGPAPGIAGPVRITITAAGRSVRVAAIANSAWQPGTNAVVRRGGDRLANTLATDADLGSADLPREFAAVLADDTVTIDVLVEPVDEDRPTLVLYRAGDGADRRLAVEIAAADAVVAHDPLSAKAIAANGGTTANTARATEAITDGGRLLAVSTSDGYGSVVAQLLAAPERPAVEVLGVPPELAVAAVSPTSAPTLVATEAKRSDLARLFPVARHTNLVLLAKAADLPKILDDAGQAMGTRTAALARAGGASSAERPWWGELGDAVRHLESASPNVEFLCCVNAVEQPGETTPDLDHARLIDALLAESVSPKTLATALAAQPGWSRRLAYDFVLARAENVSRAPK
jgi:hypothetical protein